MNKLHFDESIVTGLVAGGLGIMIYDLVQIMIGYYLTNTITSIDFQKQLPTKAYAGLTVVLIAFVYAIIIKILRKPNHNKII